MNENETMYSDLPRSYYTVATSTLKAKTTVLEVLIEIVAN
jgi:hypothetical protein